MFDYIEKLRGKKPHEKQMIALGTAAAVTGIIALCWLATLPYRFSSIQAPIPTADSVSQFQNVKDGFTQMWGNASASYQNIKTSIEASWSQPK